MPTYTDRFILTAEDRTKAATAAAQANFKRLEASAGALRTALGAVGGALILRQAARFAGDTLAMAESINDVSIKAGITAEQLQVLRFAAEQNGSSAGALDKAMLKLNVSIGEAGRQALGLESGTSEARAAMIALGVDVLDAGGNVRSSADLFPELIDRLAAIENPAERASVAAQIFGKKIGPELAVLIQGGSQSLKEFEAQLRAMNAIFSNEFIANAAKVKDQFDAVGFAIKTNFREGFLAGFVGEFGDLTKLVNDPKFVAQINDIGKQFGEAFKAIIENAPAVIAHLREIRDIVVFIGAARFATSLGKPFGKVGQTVGNVVGLAAGVVTVAALRAGDAERDAKREEDAQRARTRAAIAATRELAAAAQQRLTAESSITQRLVALKQAETERLTAELAKQKTAYDQATADVRAALQQREQIEQEFADLTQRPGGQTSNQVTLQSFAAQRALTAGDPKEALRLAREAAAALRELQSGGDTSATLQLAGRRLQQVAKDAAQAQLAQAEQAQATAQAAIQNILNMAAQIKALPVGFDTATAITDAQSLRAALEQQLAANPIVVPVVLDSSSADQFAQSQIDKAAPPGRAHGGVIPGSSPHARADNVLIRATAGEWMIQQPSARYYGAALMSAINQRLVPRAALAAAVGQRVPMYADGGLIAATQFAETFLGSGPARPNLSALASSAGLPAAPTTTINLTLPTGQTYTVRADTDTAQALQRDIRLQALKSGKR